VDVEDVQDFGLVDYIDLLTHEDLISRMRFDGPVRVDFDGDSARPGHPAAHLTISRDSCRVPLFGPLSVGHFVRFVFGNFYQEWWERYDFIRDWPVQWLPRNIADDDCLKLYVECRRPLADRVRHMLGRS
jgi:hypothetical protein